MLRRPCRDAGEATGFGRASVERTTQNFQELGHTWTEEIEQAVRARVPGWWRDIQQVIAATER